MRNNRNLYFAKYHEGFTLVELLVVIAIIALLLSILMPALNKVRMQAKVVLCASNQRQLGYGITTYMADSRDHYPPSSNHALGDPDINGYYDSTQWSRLIQKYVDASTKMATGKPFSKAYFCPLGPVPGKTKLGKQVWPKNNAYYITYGYNYAALGNSLMANQLDTSLKRVWAVTPTPADVRASEFLILVDNSFTDPAYASCSCTAAPVSTRERPNLRHHPKLMANVLFGDIHVGVMSRKQLDDDFQTVKSWAYDYPWKAVWERKR